MKPKRETKEKFPQDEEEQNHEGFHPMKNKDCIGWLTIPDTLIDHPVIKYHPEEVNYYLKRDFSENTRNGSLFLSENCSLKDCDNSIYGHHEQRKDVCRIGRVS